MALRNSKPLPFAPSGCTDALDSSDVPAGSMAALTNLIPDPTTRNLFQCRPAAFQLNEGFGLLPDAGFISVMKVVGNRVYGMVATSTIPGRDQPFCYDIAADAFVPISGTQDANTLPVSPSPTGEWQPPIMDTVGKYVVVAHAGFEAAALKVAGLIDISDPADPVWSITDGDDSGSGEPFLFAPISVAAFGDRAYYMVPGATAPGSIVLPAVVFSDILDPANNNITISAVNSNVITFDDSVALTAFGKQGLNNQLGGIVQALFVFKGVTNIYQITGDPLGGVLVANPSPPPDLIPVLPSGVAPLQRNALNVVTGTNAPLSVCSTPKGITFMSPEGFRLIDTMGNVGDPIGVAGTGVTVPFTYSVVPSRVAACAGGNTLRISTQNGFAPGTPNEEWFFNFARGVWTGPHTFPSSLIQPYNNTFIKTPIGVLATLWQSDAAQVLNSTYVENGTQLTWRYQTSLLPNTDQMCQNNMIETTFTCALTAAAGPVSCSVQDQDGVVLNSVTIPQQGEATLWGQFQWGQASWLGAASALQPRQMFWTAPIVFQRMAFTAVGQCGQSVRVGRTYFRYEMLGYLLPYPVSA